jgi:TPR repeat protein
MANRMLEHSYRRGSLPLVRWTMNPVILAALLEKLERGNALLESGDEGGAVQLWREVGDAGLAEGYFELAWLAMRLGRKDEAEKWMSRMEHMAVSNDEDELTHLSCYLAYEFRLGVGSVEQQLARGVEHLRRAAELGSSTSQALLAGCYQTGKGGLTKDPGLYEFWMSKAIDQEDADVLCYHIEQILMDGRLVSSELRSKLETAAESSCRAADLLSQLRSPGGSSD